jgi:hypothetical protein
MARGDRVSILLLLLLSAQTLTVNDAPSLVVSAVSARASLVRSPSRMVRID